MIQTKEELFLAELGINPKEEIELCYSAKIKITELLRKYANQLNIPFVSQCNEKLRATLTSRVLTIKNEPDGIVRENMINNLLIDINCY